MVIWQGKNNESQQTRVWSNDSALRRRRIDPALSPKRESQPLLQWDGKTPRTGNGGR